MTFHLPMTRHLPNMLTWLRVAASPALYATLWLDNATGPVVAAILFGVCAWTDVLDGWLARRWRAESVLGRVLDPIADKILVVTALLILVERNIIAGPNPAAQASLLAGCLIIWRELLIAGLREYLAGSAIRLPVTQWAKLKTILQMVAISLLLAMPVLEQWLAGSWLVAHALLWLAALLSLTTGAAYVRRARRQYRRQQAASTGDAPPAAGIIRRR